jgi:hypothetical protein
MSNTNIYIDVRDGTFRCVLFFNIKCGFWTMAIVRLADNGPPISDISGFAKDETECFTQLAHEQSIQQGSEVHAVIDEVATVFGNCHVVNPTADKEGS